MDTNASLPHPRFEALGVPPGVRLVDPIDGGQFSLLTPDEVDLVSRDPDTLPIPVDGVVEIDVEEVRTPYLVGVWIRDAEFTLVEQITGGDSRVLPDGRYVVEFSAAQLKVYLGIDGPFAVDATGDAVTLSTGEASEVLIGVRSYHEQPARTITTTKDPRNVMHAISQFRSALKSTSPERSFPTLRGHPPLIEFGEELSIPGGSALEDPSLSIEVPLRWDRILPVAPLAYYLNAAVVPSREPRMVVDGTRIPLDGDGSFGERIGRLLKQVFTLDCITRTEGLYNVDLHERRLIEDRVTLDFADLYTSSIAERVNAYLDVPFEVVEPALPEWKLTADVQPHADNAPVLPFMASDLAVIRCPRSSDIGPGVLEETTPDVENFFRNEPVLLRGSSGQIRAENAGNDASVSDRVFHPEPTDSLMQTFVGDGIPLGATKMTPEAFRRRLAYEPAEPGRIRVDVVTNEKAMGDESAVSEVYGAREWIDFDVAFHEELTRAELTDVLQSETDFFHYIGHVEDEGFRCADGHLDAHSLSTVEVGAFLLNACKSYAQGHALVEAGALGGIVTLANVPNPTATEIGKNLARLLNTGFSIANARSLLETDEHLASRYMVVGDGNANVVESESGGPFSVEINSKSTEVVEIDIHGYTAPTRSIGGLRSWWLSSVSEHYINPTNISQVTIHREEFDEFCAGDGFPIISSNQLRWSSDFG